MDAADDGQGRGYWRDALFYVTFLFFTVGFSPYISLSSTYLGSAMAAGSSLLNQLTAIILFFSFLAFMAKDRSFSILFMPRLLMAAIFGWFVFTSLVGEALETLFFLSIGFVWFFLIVAVMGLHLQANASLVEDETGPAPARSGGDEAMVTKPLSQQPSQAVRHS